MKSERELRHLMREYRALGWTITRTRKNHWRWRSPEGAIVINASTPSDHRGNRNHIARLKRCACPCGARYDDNQS